MCRHKEQRCRFSGVDDIGSDSRNYCRLAHSSDKLDEWNERYQWREMKKKRAKEQNLYSYMDLLIDDLESATNTSSVVCLECLRVSQKNLIFWFSGWLTGFQLVGWSVFNGPKNEWVLRLAERLTIASINMSDKLYQCCLMWAMPENYRMNK